MEETAPIHFQKQDQNVPQKKKKRKERKKKRKEEKTNVGIH